MTPDTVTDIVWIFCLVLSTMLLMAVTVIAWFIRQDTSETKETIKEIREDNKALHREDSKLWEFVKVIDARCRMHHRNE